MSMSSGVVEAVVAGHQGSCPVSSSKKITPTENASISAVTLLLPPAARRTTSGAAYSVVPTMPVMSAPACYSDALQHLYSVRSDTCINRFKHGWSTAFRACLPVCLIGVTRQMLSQLTWCGFGRRLSEGRTQQGRMPKPGAASSKGAPAGCAQP